MEVFSCYIWVRRRRTATTVSPRHPCHQSARQAFSQVPPKSPFHWKLKFTLGFEKYYIANEVSRPDFGAEVILLILRYAWDTLWEPGVANLNAC